MVSVNTTLSRSVLIFLGLLATGSLVSPTGGARAAAAPFEGLSGKWAGEGSIARSNGTTERLRCDATYAVSGGGVDLEQNLHCVSDSYNINLRVSLEDNDGAIVGNFIETNNNIQGGISGRESKGVIRLAVTGQTFSANVSVVTRGSTQSVKIRADSGDLSQVDISLHHTR
jgi:hypothetical protein